MIKKIALILFLGINSCQSQGQITLIREGIIINNTEPVTWLGDNIPRSEPTLLTYRNNSITSINRQGYMLQSGDEKPLSTNNNLDGQVISGNKFTWNGPDSDTIITHGIFLGYNKNSVVKYNYVDRAPYGLIFKSGTDDGQNMTFTEGGCAYNIFKNGKFAVRMKGINGLKIMNNTFYSDNGSGRYFILITKNADRLIPSPSTGTKIFNNIFYSTKQIPMIQIEGGCLEGFECDYNVYWCTNGEPKFVYDGKSITWAAWKAMGYDTHSVIADPNFINTTDLVPTSRMDFGKILESEWQVGLATNATWIPGTSPESTNQNGTWQVGARIYNGPIASPVTSITVSGLNTISTDNGTLQLNVSVLPSHSTIKSVIWSIINGTGQATINSAGLVTAVENGTVTAYATANDGSGVSGKMDITISNQVPSSIGLEENKKKTEMPWTITDGNELIIFSDQKFKTGKATLYTIQGSLIADKIIENTNIVFDISGLSSGIYIVAATEGINSGIVKVVIP